MTKMTLKVKVNDLHYQYQKRVSLHATLVIPAQTCDELPHGQCKVYGRMDRRADAGNDNTPSA